MPRQVNTGCRQAAFTSAARTPRSRRSTRLACPLSDMTTTLRNPCPCVQSLTAFMKLKPRRMKVMQAGTVCGHALYRRVSPPLHRQDAHATQAAACSAHAHAKNPCAIALPLALQVQEGSKRRQPGGRRRDCVRRKLDSKWVISGAMHGNAQINHVHTQSVTVN